MSVFVECIDGCCTVIRIARPCKYVEKITYTRDVGLSIWGDGEMIRLVFEDYGFVGTPLLVKGLRALAADLETRHQERFPGLCPECGGHLGDRGECLNRCND